MIVVLFEHAAVAVGKYHVEEETETDVAEKQESREKSPNLPVIEDESRVVVELQRADQLRAVRGE